jgi:hypothetical protein
MNTGFFCELRVTLIAGALSTLVALGGCGGGGGGGGVVGGSGGPSGFQYPILTDALSTQVGGFSAAYTLDTGTSSLESINPGSGSVTVILNSPDAGDYSFAVSNLNGEPAFVFNVDAAALAAGAGVTVAGATCPACFRRTTVTANAPDSEQVTITVLDLAVAQMTYSTMGLWSKPSSVPGSDVEVGSAFSFGVPTRGVDLPTTGGATYTGPMIGRYAGIADGAGGVAAVYDVGAAATAIADFGLRSVAFSTVASMRTPVGGGLSVSDSNLNLTGTLMYSAGSNQLTSTTPTSLTSGYGMSGNASALFYGPPATSGDFAPPELGGALAVRNGDGSQSMVGSFALKKQP